MTDESEIMWTKHFHYTTTESTKNKTDLYTLRHNHDVKKVIIFAVATGNKELPAMLEKAMNGIAAYYPEEDFIEAFKRIFYGPWAFNELTKKFHITLTREDERNLQGLFYHESAERIMAEANLATLKKDFIRLQKTNEVLSRALMRAQVNNDLPKETNVYTTMSDLMEPQNEPEDLFDQRRVYTDARNPCEGFRNEYDTSG